MYSSMDIHNNRRQWTIEQYADYYMIQIIRRSSNGKINERWHEHFLMLNKIVCENSKANLRDSLDPLHGMNLMFNIVRDDMLSRECLETILKNTEKDVLTVGFVLPGEMIRSCYQTIIGKPEQTYNKQTLFGTFVEKSQNVPVNTLYLFYEDNQSLEDEKPDIQQKFLYNFCMAWIVTQRICLKRLNFWETRQQIFQKKSSLLLIKESQELFPAEVSQKLQTLFWNIAIFTSQALSHSKKKQHIQYLTVKTGYRQPYRELAEQPHENESFASLFSQFSRIALKGNYKYSSSLFCVPVVYYLCCWFKEEHRNSKQQIQICLNGYFKHLEQEISKFLDNIHLPLDQLKLRASVTAEKKNFLMSIKRHIKMFEGLFRGVDFMDKYLQNLTRIYTDKEEDVYRTNSRRATSYNQDLISRLYSQIITKKFEQNATSDRLYSEYKSDFRALLDCYGSESVRVNTQLKTFNEFIMQRKIEYAEYLEKELQGSKRRYIISEKEELKDRLQIQMGVLDTLEDEIRQLQEQRMSIEDDNQNLKKALSEIRIKSISKQANANSPKKKGNSAETKTLRKQAKPTLHRTAKLQLQKGKGKCCGCCCQVM